MNRKLKKKVIIRMLQEYLQVAKTRKKNPKKKQKMKMQKKVKAMKIICIKKKT